MIFPMLLGIELPGLAAASSPLGQRSHTAKGSAVLILPDRRTATPTALSSIFTEWHWQPKQRRRGTQHCASHAVSPSSNSQTTQLWKSEPDFGNSCKLPLFLFPLPHHQPPNSSRRSCSGGTRTHLVSLYKQTVVSGCGKYRPKEGCKWQLVVRVFCYLIENSRKKEHEIESSRDTDCWNTATFGANMRWMSTGWRLAANKHWEEAVLRKYSQPSRIQVSTAPSASQSLQGQQWHHAPKGFQCILLDG